MIDTPPRCIQQQHSLARSTPVAAALFHCHRTQLFPENPPSVKVLFVPKFARGDFPCTIDD